MRCPLPLLQLYQGPYNAGGTTLSQVPTSQKLLLLQGYPVLPQALVAFITFCTIGATCAPLHLRGWTGEDAPFFVHTCNTGPSFYAQIFHGTRWGAHGLIWLQWVILEPPISGRVRGEISRVRLILGPTLRTIVQLQRQFLSATPVARHCLSSLLPSALRCSRHAQIQMPS